MTANGSRPRRRKHDASFRKEVLQMIRHGRPVSKVARSLGIGENIIYRRKTRSSQLQLVRRTARRLMVRISSHFSNRRELLGKLLSEFIS